MLLYDELIPIPSWETLDVQLNAEELAVTGQRKWQAPEKGGCVHSERPYGQFHRVFRLGIPLHADRVQATYRGNYTRLARVKQKYDPGNLFRVNQNVRPSS